MATSPYPEGISIQDGDELPRILNKILARVSTLASDPSLSSVPYPEEVSIQDGDDPKRICNKILALVTFIRDNQ